MKNKLKYIIALSILIIISSIGYFIFYRYSYEDEYSNLNKEIEEAFLKQREIDSIFIANGDHRNALINPEFHVWFINANKFNNLIDSYEYYSTIHSNGYDFQLILARHNNGRPKFISTISANFPKNCDIKTEAYNTNFLALCEYLDNNRNIKHLLRYDSPDGEFSAAKYYSEKSWRCYLKADANFMRSARVSNPLFCKFDIIKRSFL